MKELKAKTKIAFVNMNKKKTELSTQEMAAARMYL
jgi:hypothetical protein